MINSELFVKRLEKIIQFYGLSASHLADKIGVQRSSISHLLTGRNRPSLEFVMKLVTKFPEVNLYWVLYGQGNFPEMKKGDELPSSVGKVIKDKGLLFSNAKDKAIAKVIIFYRDGSFEMFENDRA